MKRNSYSNAVQGVKRQANTNNNIFITNLSLGKFVASKEFLKYLDDCQAFHQISHEFPRFTVQHAVRVSFGHTAALQLDEVWRAIVVAYLKARGIEKKYYQGFFDLTFHNAADAEEAAAIHLMVNGRWIPTSQCRWNQDETIYITFTKIPTTLTRENTIK